MLFRHFAKIALTAASFENRFFPRYFSISVIYNMPPKKKEEEKPTPLMGRFGTSLKCGIVGLPNVGKSTFFNVLTKSAAAAENFPFCTIVKRLIQIPSLSNGVKFEYMNVPWEAKMLIGGLVTHQLISSSVVGVGSLIDGSQNTVLLLALEDEFRRITKKSSKTVAILMKIMAVPDERWDFLCEFHKPASKVPAFLHVTDIAGLVQGAHEGQGLGNAFLSHIWACDAIFHMIRAFEGEDVTHVEGDVNPVRDLEIISEELRKKDEEYLKDKVNNMEKTVIRGGDKKRVGEYESLKKICHTVSEDKKHVRFVTWDAKEIEVLNKHLLLTSKPVIYLVNLSEKDYIRKKNKWLAKIKEWVDANDSGAVIIPFSGALESKLLDMEQEEAEKYLKEAGTQSALAKIITTGFKALQLQYFFTAGKDEVKAWTILKGTKAPQAAGKIHTDFEKGFIMAEVMKFEDFKEHGSEAAAKAAGKYKQEGKNYVVNDGDIIFFKFNAGAGLTDKKKVK